MYMYRDTDRERAIEAQKETEMTERDWQSQAGTERYIEKERKRERDMCIHRGIDRERDIQRQTETDRER